MTVLLFTVAGMQAWATGDRHAYRHTQNHPTKSGILGMIACAMGYPRDNTPDWLNNVRFGVRVDHPGTVIRDYQNCPNLVGKTIQREKTFLDGDACFTIAIEGEITLLERMQTALLYPAHAVCLGRRSLPPAEPFAPHIEDGTIEENLHRTETDLFFEPADAMTDSDQLVQDSPRYWRTTGSTYVRRPERHIPAASKQSSTDWFGWMTGGAQ